jgi:hypothetical protein
LPSLGPPNTRSARSAVQQLGVVRLAMACGGDKRLLRSLKQEEQVRIERTFR